MSRLHGKWINKDLDNLTHSGDNLAVKFSDDEAADPNKVWSSEKINTISGSLSAEIDADIAALVDAAPETLDTLNELAAALGDDANFSTTVINMITTNSGALDTHKSSGDHDGRYYTETELDAGQLDNRYYTETEVDALTWTESDITDLDKYTQAEVDALFTTVSGDIVSQIPTDYYTQTEVNTISGALNDKIGAAGATSEVEYFTLSAGHIANKYIDLTYTPAVAADVMMDIIGGGPQVYGVDYIVASGTELGWGGLALDGVLEATDKMRVLYTY